MTSAPSKLDVLSIVTVFPFIDKYGQYKHEDWPNKIKNDRDLIKQRIAEDEELRNHPAPKS